MTQCDKDVPVLAHIQRLVNEEHGLQNRGELGAEETHRLAVLKIELDLCWDLLRERQGAMPSQVVIRGKPGDATLMW